MKKGTRKEQPEMATYRSGILCSACSIGGEKHAVIESMKFNVR